FLLSAIIQEMTGASALAFAEEHLFGPLGISDVEWPSNPQGITIGWGELRMKPHDMAKIGYLYLNEGLWDGEQVVPSAWVEKSTRKHIPATLQDGYGYQWWIDSSGVYMALGYAGQFIFVVPEKDMVVVFTSNLDEERFYVPQTLLNDFIVPAAKASTPLPPNPDGVALLEYSIKALATSQTSVPVPPTGTATPVIAATAAPTAPSGDGVVQGWAVLAEKDDYSDVNMSDLPVDYIGIAQMRQVLEDSGWEADHVRELREFDREALQDGLDWLAEDADEDDIVFLYVTSHGKYLKDVLAWGDFFAADWAAIPSQRRLLVIDACQAANYTGAVAGDPAPYMSIAAVAGDEYGWSGLEEEGLPIIGGVFTHYFAAAFDNPDADTDADGFVSAQEAALVAEEQQRTYMHEVVFAVPEFVEMYHRSGVFPDENPAFPHVIVDDTIGQPLYLELDAYP
ncbi:MAG: serine hydrolase, partial [Chloroflexota bacterium]|nr:serine hydrolase [Chloroflexota bacterium]